MYDFIIVGSGLYGAILARELTDCNKKCLVLEKRKHIGGNCYTENIEGINVHKYGPHIFHTNNNLVWSYINKFVKFNNFINRPKVFYKGKIYSFPINLLTLYQVWGVKTPEDAIKKFNEQKIYIGENNLEEYALSHFGLDLYNIFIKGYTTKQWQNSPKNLPIDIIKRLVIRTDFNDNYYNDKYQGIPIDGYTKIFYSLLRNIEVRTSVDYLEEREYWNKLTKNVIYTGKIDEYFDYCFGELKYRTQNFIEELYHIKDYQGCAQMNYTDIDVPYTRIIEHKHFDLLNTNNITIISKEYPQKYNKNKIPMYPINDTKNNTLFEKYKNLSNIQNKIIFGGRLGDYKYYDMEHVIALAIKKSRELLDIK